MPNIEWVPVVASLILIGAGLMFLVSPTWALILLDFAHLVLGDRDMARWYRNSPPKVSGSIVPDVVARSPSLKLQYRIGGALLTLLGVSVLLSVLFRAPGN
jgi:hypothetical protein